VEAAKALGGSFKLVTLAPKTVREMTQLPKETQKNGDTQTNQRNTNEYTKYKPRRYSQKNTLGPTGLYELVPVAEHMENFQCTSQMPGTTSTALPSFSHDQHHETDTAKRKGGVSFLQNRQISVVPTPYSSPVDKHST